MKLPIPTQDPRVYLKLLQLDLAAHPPTAAVKKITIEAFPAPLRFDQGGFFQPSAPKPAEMEITIARLRAIVGEQDESGRLLVGFPIVQDSHEPGSFDVVHSAVSGIENESSHRCEPKLALRVFRPPIKVNVGVSADKPTAVVIHGKRKSVVKASGPMD